MIGAQPWIMWAEDNPQDRMLIQDSVDRLPSQPRLTMVCDGLLLLDALQEGRPDIVVLDLKMPRLGGLEALRRIRNSPGWSALRVIVFSSGNRPDEIEQCHALGVNEVVQKPVDFDQFSSAVQAIAQSAPAQVVEPASRGASPS